MGMLKKPHRVRNEKNGENMMIRRCALPFLDVIGKVFW